MILEGKKKRLVTTLEKEMKEAAKKSEFEKAAETRNKIFALNHIRDIALMSKDFDAEQSTVIGHPSLVPQVEAYDISNISGKQAVGSMVVFSGKNPDKSQYRKFKIKSVEGPDDVAMMREVLARRIGNDWPKPDLVLLDGGRGHLNMAKELFEALGFDVLLVAVAKGPTRKKLDLRVSDANQRINANPRIAKMLEDENFLKHIMDEAHRFAITYHRKRRGKEMLE
ncbi:MAG: UvrABC system protein C [Candidatus Moranbacteria bacterium GW2011_GWE1_49_15]|nr:MAG: UvrABC system protein C [Candidatus Moranbacteria bacterium GW2011_GWE1_49_15]